MHRSNASHQTRGPRNRHSVWQWTSHDLQMLSIYNLHHVFLLENGSSPFFHFDLLGDTVSITFVPLPVAGFPMFPPQDGWGMLGGADVGSGALLLDCDGTLAETERDGHRVAFNKAFQAWWLMVMT